MRFLIGATILSTAAFFSAGAEAQMSVTTIGATEATKCFENARDEFSDDVEPCDDALDDHLTTRRDMMKTLVNRGIIHNRNGDLAEAVDDFNAALEIDSELAEAYLNRGNSYYLSGRHDEALADYETALRYDLQKPWAAWYNIGLVYEAQKQPEKAREAYQKALMTNPNFTLAKLKLEDE